MGELKGGAMGRNVMRCSVKLFLHRCSGIIIQRSKKRNNWAFSNDLSYAKVL